MTDPEAIRQKRIAELERKITEIENENETAPDWGSGTGISLLIISISLQKVHAQLVAAIAQSDAQPVGWQPRRPESQRSALPNASEWIFALFHSQEEIARHGGYSESRPLYTAPPRPDAAGLIEAADMAHAKAMGMLDGKSAAELFELEDELRSRAADRSAPRSDKGGA